MRAKGFIDTGFGFPVCLINVPMVKVRGTWTPSINYNELAHGVLRALAHKTSRLTGNEMKFIRTHFEMPRQAFARMLRMTQATVLEWERAGDRDAGMSEETEAEIRMFIRERESRYVAR